MFSAKLGITILDQLNYLPLQQGLLGSGKAEMQGLIQSATKYQGLRGCADLASLTLPVVGSL